MSGVCHTAPKGCGKLKFRWLFACASLLLIAASLIAINNVMADESPFEVVGAEITTSSPGVISSISSFDGTEITADTTYYREGDSVAYLVTVKNTDEIPHTITKISDDNQNAYIEYFYDQHSGETVAAGESFALEVVATYKNAISSITARSQSFVVHFTIDYEEVAVPDTGIVRFGESIKDVTPVIMIIAGAAILVVILIKNKTKASVKIVGGLFLLGAVMVPSIAKAVAAQVVFEIDNTIELKSLLVLGYTVAGQEDATVVPYGETVDIDDPERTGYDFAGWQTASGEAVDSSMSMNDDIEIIAQFTPHTYTVTFDKNAGSFDIDGSMEDQSFTYDVAQTLATNGFTISYPGYGHGGWNTRADGTGTHYDNLEEVSNLTADKNGEVTLYAEWVESCSVGNICYYANGGNGIMNVQTATAGEEAMLDAPNYDRSGYGFAGWNTKADGSGILYGPNETVVAPENNGLKLYADWVASAGNLQEFSCKTLARGAITALTDTRDGQTYAVAKLADNKCWMIENLRLNFASLNTPLSAENTNSTTDAFFTAANADPAPASSDSLSSTNQISYNTKNITRVDDDARYGYGVYYSWYTTRAGGNGVSGDICPYGWRVPGGELGSSITDLATFDFALLTNALGGAQNNYGLAQDMNSSTTPTGAEMSRTLRATKNNFVYSGKHTSSAAMERGSAGYYWTLTPSNINGSIGLYAKINDATVSQLTNIIWNGDGLTIRCVKEYLDYSIKFDGNASSGSSGSMINQHMVNNEPAKLRKNTFARTNYRFVGWNTKADGTGTSYSDEQEVNNLVQEQGGSITLYAQWEQAELVAGIRYYANGEDVVGTMDDQYVSKSTKTTTLDATNFSRTGYGFVGWNTEPDGSGTLYGPMETITMPASGTLELYADWLASAGTLQDFDCIMADGGITALTDIRDGQTYTVAKLADNKCWMTENLRLDFANLNMPISTDNTNRPTEEFMATVNADPAPTAEDSTWCERNREDCDYKIAFDIDNITRANTRTRYGYGVYYDWYTASAGKLKDNFLDNDHDICPYGWSIANSYFSGLSNALGGVQNEYGIAQNMNANTTPTGTEMSKILRSAPNNFVYSGQTYHINSYQYTRGDSGAYWSQTTRDSYDNQGYLYSYAFNLYSSSVSFSVQQRRIYGLPIRCVANAVYYNIDFNKNHNGEGGGWMMPMSVAYDLPTKLHINDFTRDGYEFVGWNTEPDGTGVSYGDQEEVRNLTSVKNGTATLYAQWSNENATNYSVIFDKNHDTYGSGSMTKQYINYDEVAALRKNTFTRDGYEFVKWNTKPDGTGTDYSDEEDVTNLAARIDGSITLYAQWEYSTNRITYDANGGEGNMHPRTVTVGEKRTLDGPNFRRIGYGFVGWNTEPDGSGVMYGPTEAITISEGGELKLYAIWIASSGNLQNFDCGTLASGNVTALSDVRDGQAYTVAKLADGKCWMTENLRLNFEDLDMPIDSNNTNNPSENFLAAINADPVPDSNGGFCTNDTINCINRIEYDIFNIQRLNSSYTADRYNYGVYYNWHTATAGHGVFDITTETTMDGDICPAGWHLPTGTGSGEFGLLSNALGGYQIDTIAQTMDNNTTPTGTEMSGIVRSIPNNFSYSGDREISSSWDQGKGVYLWTSASTSSNAYAYSVFISDVRLIPGTGNKHKSHELPIRCIAN